MKLLYLIGLCTFIYLNSYTQDCNKSTVAMQAGAWKDVSTTPASGIPPAELSAEKKNTAALHAMMKAKYVPTGVDANFSSAYERPYATAPVNIFRYSIYPLNLYCDANTVKAVHETSSYFSISANAFDAEIYENAPEDHPLGYFTLDDMPIEKDGYYFFPEKDESLGFGMTGKQSKWLITIDKKLPFSYVSKKEFLIKRKQILSKQKEQSASGHRDVLNALEIGKKYKVTEYKSAPDKMQKYLQLEYLPTKERYEKLLAENENHYKGAFDKIENLLKRSDTELAAPAIVRIDPKDDLSYLFTDDNDSFGKILIKPNPGYFNKNLARSAPQFFSVYMVGNHKEPVAAATMADLTKAIDFTKLKGMLGK